MLISPKVYILNSLGNMALSAEDLRDMLGINEIEKIHAVRFLIRKELSRLALVIARLMDEASNSIDEITMSQIDHIIATADVERKMDDDGSGVEESR